MFSDALLHALENGNPKQRSDLDLRTIKGLAEEYLSTNYGQDAPKPEVHSPDQTEGDVATVPIFPNTALRLTKVNDLEQTVESANRLHSMFSLVAALNPSGFTRVLDYLNNNEDIKRTKERVSDELGTADLYKEGLVALAQYYPVPPPHSSNDFGFLMYKELLERNLMDERYAGYAAVRLLQLRVLEIKSHPIAGLFDSSNDAASEIFRYLIDIAENPAQRQWAQEKLGDILVICAKADRLDTFKALAGRHKAHFNPEGDYQIFYPTLTLANGLMLEIYLDMEVVKETALKHYIKYSTDQIGTLVTDWNEQERLRKYVSAYITNQITKPDSLDDLLKMLKSANASIDFSQNDIIIAVHGENFVKYITIELDKRVQAEFLKWYFKSPYYLETTRFAFPTESGRAH